jgi:hypothetical protein
MPIVKEEGSIKIVGTFEENSGLKFAVQLSGLPMLGMSSAEMQGKYPMQLSKYCENYIHSLKSILLVGIHVFLREFFRSSTRQ